MEKIFLVVVTSSDNFNWDNIDVEVFPFQTRERAMEVFNDNSGAMSEDFYGADSAFVSVKKTDTKHTYIDSFSGKYSEVKLVEKEVG